MAVEELLTILVLLPLGAFGLWKLVYLIKETLAVRRGYFKVVFRLSNHRIITRLVKPEKDIIRFKDKIYPFSNSLGFVYYYGNIPTVEYDINGNQINFLDSEKTSELDPDNLSNVGIRTYNLGKIHGRKEEKYILYASLAAAGASIIAVILLIQQMQGIVV